MTQTTWRGYLAANAEPETPELFALISAMTIGMAARNAIEDLHVAGLFSDAHAPALNRRLRGYAYEVMLAIERLRSTHDRSTRDDLAAFLRNQAAVDGARDEEIEPVSALRGAIRQAIRDFSRATDLPSSQATKLEAAAVSDAEGAYLSWETIGHRKSREQVAYLATMVPDYWELPEVRPGLRHLFARPATSVSRLKSRRGV